MSVQLSDPCPSCTHPLAEHSVPGGGKLHCTHGWGAKSEGCACATILDVEPWASVCTPRAVEAKVETTGVRQPELFAAPFPTPIPSSVLAPPAVVDVRKCVDCGGDVGDGLKYRCKTCLEKRS